MKLSLIVGLFLLSNISLGQEQIVKKLDSLTNVYESHNYHGVVLVAKGGAILYQRGYGYANFEKRIKHAPETAFKTESVGKMFTATCIMQLVEQGKLTLSQTITDILPELDIKNADKITVHQLLAHTSGLQSPWDYPEWNFKKIYTRAEQEAIYKKVPVAFDEPGKRFYYSNIGYVILSWMVEKVSGLSFDQYLSKFIFEPQGMRNIRHLMDTVLPADGIAHPYRILSTKKYVKHEYAISPRASGAGGWITPAVDLYRFMLGLDNGKYLSSSTFNIMQTANQTNPKDSSYRYYAYGLETYVNQPVPGTKIYGHNGGGAGYSIDAILDPANHIIVVSCTNLYQNSRPIAFNYMKLALGKNADTVKQLAAVRLYDLIDSVGIDGFLAREKEYFRKLNITPDVRFFGNMGEALEAAGDLTSWSKWMALGHSYFPNNTFLMIISGDSQAKLGNKVAAKKFYEAARELALKENDHGAIAAVEEKMKAL